MTVDQANEMLTRLPGVESFLVQDMAQMYPVRQERGDGSLKDESLNRERCCRVVIDTGKKLAELRRPTIAEAVRDALAEAGLG